MCIYIHIQQLHIYIHMFTDACVYTYRERREQSQNDRLRKFWMSQLELEYHDLLSLFESPSFHLPEFGIESQGKGRAPFGGASGVPFEGLGSSPRG